MVVAGHRSEPGGKIDRIADHCGVETSLPTDHPQYKTAGVDSGPDSKGWVTFGLQFLIQFVEPVEHLEAGADRGVGPRWKDAHDRIADILVDESTVSRDGRLHVLEIAAHELEGLSRREGFGYPGESLYIGEEDRHVSVDLVADLNVGDARLFEDVEELVGHE